MGLNPINLYGTKGRENILLYGLFCPGKILFSSPFLFFKNLFFKEPVLYNNIFLTKFN